MPFPYILGISELLYQLCPNLLRRYLGGIHVGAQRIGGAPELAFKADGRGAVVGFWHAFCPFNLDVLGVLLWAPNPTLTDRGGRFGVDGHLHTDHTRHL